jgi:hypothetical protein
MQTKNSICNICACFPGIRIFLRSEGCGDPRLEASGCGKAYIKVNGKEYSPQKRGYNVVVVDYLTGR